MKHPQTTYGFLTFLLAILLITACQKDNYETPDPVDLIEIQNIIINNNVAVLNKRLTLRDELVSIDRTNNTIGLKSGESETVDYTSNYAFKLKADVDPPQVNDAYVMATHVAIHDNFAFVSYNTRGSIHGGAVEVFDITSITNPQIISQAIFPDADINSVDYDNGKIFIVGAMEKFEEFEMDGPAFLQVISLNGQMQIEAVDTIIDIRSFSANSIKVSADRIMITSGDQGDYSVFDREYNEIARVPVSDARSVAFNSANAFVLSGQPGTLNVFDKNTATFIESFETGGANIPHSKSQICATEQYIFAALNEGGMKVYETNGTLKQHIPKPETPDGALDENHVTNSVSVNYNLVFFANGESGISVGEMIGELEDEVIIMGTMVFSDMQSSNFVQSRDSLVFVASGLGGLKILAISIDEGVPDDVIPSEPCPTLMDAITLLFPETQNAMNNHPHLFEAGAVLNITTEEETDVYLKFVWEGAGWKNTLGYYYYPANNPPASVADLEKHVVFPNTSMVGSGGGLEPGDMVQLGSAPFPANTVIGFYLVAQGWGNGEMVNGVYTHYTDIQFNPNNTQQHVLFIENGCQDLVLGFEDIRLPGGDKDFNDVIFVLKDNPEQLPNTKFNTEGIISFDWEE
ncbi:MAG: DUF4114 domain-containing protein [Bacteroidetes bacterium]|nr:MAG: DUF4114 domain-containing protein [Bacteroidota bacterium]